jgi:predicted NUDIX family NTP pyrophosphohydrolase
MRKQSAGLLMYRWRNANLEVFLVHPGGPFWANKDLGSWSIPKGEFDEGQDPLEAGKREFTEETGLTIAAELSPLQSVKQPSGKIIFAWAFEGDCDETEVKSNTFDMEWPRRSGQRRKFPEIDRAGWFSIKTAKEKIVPGQAPLLADLEARLANVK